MGEDFREKPDDSTYPSIGLGQQLRHDIPMHVGQAVFAALVAEGQAFVIEAQQVQHGGVEVVCVDWISRDAETELVGFAVGDSAADAASGQPHCVGVFVVVAAGSLRFGPLVSGNNWATNCSRKYCSGSLAAFAPL